MTRIGDDEAMIRAAALPQAGAGFLVDAAALEAQVKEMYGRVAREEESELHFEVGRDLAEHLGYPPALLDAIPPEALASFAGVGWHLDLADLRAGESVLDLGSGSGTDVFCAAVQVGVAGEVTGVDFTPAQLAKAGALRDRDEFTQVSFAAARIDELPFADATFDVVISNGVINLSVVKHRVFAEAARVLKPGGRLALSDIVSGRPLKERTRRNVELWAACIAGAIPRGSYVETIEAAGLEPREVRRNDYRFISARARRLHDLRGREHLAAGRQAWVRRAGARRVCPCHGVERPGERLAGYGGGRPWVGRVGRVWSLVPAGPRDRRGRSRRGLLGE